MIDSIKNIIIKIKNFFKSKHNEDSLNITHIYNIKVSVEKEVAIKGKDKINTLLNLEIYGRLLFYGIMIGFIHNYVFFNLFFKFNIFDFIQTSDLLFSWVNSKGLVTTICIFMIIYLIGLFHKKFTKVISSISLLIIVSFFYIVHEYFILPNLIEADKNKNVIWSIFSYLYDFNSLIVIFLQFLIMFLIIQIIKPIKDDTDYKFIEVVIVVGAFVFTGINALTESYKSEINPKLVNISYRIIYDEKKYQNEEIEYLGRTSSVTILKRKSAKLFIVVNNEDISSLEFLEDVNVEKK